MDAYSTCGLPVHRMPQGTPRDGMWYVTYEFLMMNEVDATTASLLGANTSIRTGTRSPSGESGTTTEQEASPRSLLSAEHVTGASGK
jgi:hypothetical protein